MRGATLFTKVSITCTSRQPWQESALSKVASCWWKSLPAWLVSAGYSAWHFFMDGVFLKKYPWTGCLLWQPGHLLQNFLTTLRMLMLKLTDCSSRVLATIELFFTILHRTQKRVFTAQASLWTLQRRYIILHHDYSWPKINLLLPNSQVPCRPFCGHRDLKSNKGTKQ